MKTFNLFVLRRHLQARARMVLDGELYSVVSGDHDLHDHRECPPTPEPMIKNVEKYEIQLDTTNPNLPNLYTSIQEVCPEFADKKSFHLYWKNSSKTIVPVSNYITYVSMISLIATANNNLYLVAREWEGKWLTDARATYVAVPEDVVLINMAAPPQSVYTMTQEIHMKVVEAAGKVETSRTYSPPRIMSKKEKVSNNKEKSPKSPKKTKKK